MRVLLVGFAIFIGMPSLAYAQPPCAPIYWCREGNWLDRHCWCYRHGGQWGYGGERWWGDGPRGDHDWDDNDDHDDHKGKHRKHHDD